MNWKSVIVTDNQILAGKPVIKGTRLSVDHVVSLFAKGWDEAKILENYPALTKEHLQAVFQFLHESIKDGIFVLPNRKSA